MISDAIRQDLWFKVLLRMISVAIECCLMIAVSLPVLGEVTGDRESRTFQTLTRG